MIRKLIAGDEAMTEAFLSNYAQTCMFIRSNLKQTGFAYKEASYHGEYWGSFDGGHLSGVLAHYWNGNLMVQARNEQAVAVLADGVRSSLSRPVEGLLGPEEQVAFLINAYDLATHDYATNARETLYALDLNNLVMPPKPDGRVTMVNVGAINADLLFQWIRDYDIEALGSEEGEELDEQAMDRVARYATKPDCWALLLDDVAVSMSGFNARLPDMVQIGPVWTPPEYRSRGYARLLVAMTLEKARNEGAQQSILFTNNPPAAKAYEAIGFKDSGKFRLALLKKPTLIPTG